eukprot:6788160-Lingulodinium_polyedra.AAC.1
MMTFGGSLWKVPQASAAAPTPPEPLLPLEDGVTGQEQRTGEDREHQASDAEPASLVQAMSLFDPAAAKVASSAEDCERARRSQEEALKRII